VTGADELFEQVRAGRNGEAANLLLREFFHGYPIERLRDLLRSDNDDVVASALFIAGELYEQAAPVMDEVARLLDHPDWELRFDAADAVAYVASSEHGAAIAKAVRLVRDQDERVRWRALRLLGNQPQDKLAASLPWVEDSELRELLSWLLAGEDSEAYKREVVARLRGADRLARMFAGAAASRLADTDRALLELAARSEQPEVRRNAEAHLDYLALRERQQERRRQRAERRRQEEGRS
jgi:hypothetical protein